MSRETFTFSCVFSELETGYISYVYLKVITRYNEAVGNIGNVVTPLCHGPRHYRRCSSCEYTLEEPTGHLAIIDTGPSPVGEPDHSITFSIGQREAEEPIRQCTEDCNRTIQLYCTNEISTAVGGVSTDLCTIDRLGNYITL